MTPLICVILMSDFSDNDLAVYVPSLLLSSSLACLGGTLILSFFEPPDHHVNIDLSEHDPSSPRTTLLSCFIPLDPQCTQVSTA
mmetsp:Transcript_55617/g.166673  ORF Transcript_55617/g.166673 Transcript_55617/m.166673 type:complete len:84 (+) Transcript_55617:687-938(+)